MTAAVLSPETEQGLAIIPSGNLVTSRDGGFVPSTRGNALTKRTAPHPKKCRCVRCRRGRARRQATPDYIEATVITIDEETGEQFYGGASPYPDG